MCISQPVFGKEQDLVYKKAGEREIWLRFLPPLQQVYDKAPLYFIIPGGGWAESVKENMVAFSQVSVDALRAEGWAVVSVEYRLWNRDGASMADILSDVYDAMAYVAGNAEILGIDADKVLYSGHSAGGQLCLMAAMAKRGLKAIGCAPLSPPTVFPAIEGKAFYPAPFWKRENWNTLFPGGEADARAASPALVLTEDCPPLLLCAGDADPLVYAENTFYMAQLAQEKGVSCRVVISHNGGHCFETLDAEKPSCPDGDSVQREVIAFAREVLKG